MSNNPFYPIGTPGQPWTDQDRATWLATQDVKRSYADEVLAKLRGIDPQFEMLTYGELSVDAERYPIVALRTKEPKADAPWILITGGVHGYETSGVQGAISFLLQVAPSYGDRFNFVIAPCVSPWGYEVINRWNPAALDPNRSFVANSPAEESAALMRLVASMGVPFLVHLDLHETTDTDETEFRPALAARDGEAFEPGTIPDGFYTVADTHNPQPAFQAAIITGVKAVTHIAPADANGQLIGADVTQPGVIHYAFKPLGLCAGVTDARFTTTTEVYPDSDQVTDEDCNRAQVAAVVAALDFALSQ